MTKDADPSTERGHRNRARAMEPVGYADFVRLCRIDSGADLPGMDLRSSGVYLDQPLMADPLPHNERAVLSEHPTGNLDEPLLLFPCTLKDLQRFLEDQGLYGCIDAFDMADWMLEKTRNRQQESRSVLARPAESVSTKEEPGLLRILAGIIEKAYGNGAVAELSSERSKLTGVIQDDLEKHVSIDRTTTTKYLKRLAEVQLL